jgi:uncharacterized protein (DUF1015 family)
LAIIAPFHGIHYPPSRELAGLLAPPYDIINDREHKRLCMRHHHNIIHLTLGAPGRRRAYRQIGQRLRRWLHEGVLTQDQELCLYAYSQEYVHEGHVLEFWGILGLLHLEPFRAGKIFPHEAVNAGPVEDRLKILEGTRANLEPIIALYRAPADPISLLFESLEALPPALTTSYPNAMAGSEGSRHRIWKLSSGRTRARIQRALKRFPLFIADGHHRYHASWLFRQRHHRLRGAHWMMALIANMDQKGLIILPYHRTATCSISLTTQLPASCERFGRVERLGKNPSQALTHPGRNTLGFYAKHAGAWLLHLPPPPQTVTPRDALEVARLHEILPQMARITDLAFVKDPAEAIQASRGSPATLACFLPPPSASAITDIAFSGEILPQKSTFFLPKPLSGLILRSL